MITQEQLREVLSYNPDTGEFRWRVKTAQRIKVGDVAGSINRKGYRRITVDGKSYAAARLAFLYMTGAWPKNEADHRDTDPGNDRWENLRDATPAQNCHNRRRHSDNATGVKGVTWHKATGKYQVKIMVNGRQIHLGVTENLHLAGYMYQLAAVGYHRDFARAA